MSKLPLENPAAERAILGAMIANTTEFWALKNRITEPLFTVPINRQIVKIAHRIAESGRDLSIAGIASKIPRDDSLTFSVEGYLATLVGDEAEPGAVRDLLDDLEDMAARRAMFRFGEELIRAAREDNGLDAVSRLEAAKEKVDEIADPFSGSVRHASEIAQKLMASVSQSAMSEQTIGLDCGLKAFQDLAGSLMPGRLYLLAGPPGSGKSALAYQIAEHASRTTPVLIESIEMEGDELVQRDLASRTGISPDKIERAAVSDDDIERLYEAAENLNELHLYIDSMTSPKVAQIRAKAMRMKRTRGLGLLVIDHLLYIDRPDRKMGEFEGIRANLQALKKLAKDLKIPILLLTQLKKEFGEGPWQQIRRPGVNDLYGGSAPEQEADVVLFVHREEYLLKRKEPDAAAKDRAEWDDRVSKVTGLAELIVAKRRGGQAHGIRTAFFDGPRVRFTDGRPSRVHRPDPDDYIPGFNDAQGSLLPT